MLTSGDGRNEVTIVHHEVGDLIEAWNDGLENNCTYLFHPEDEEHYFNKGTYELICYGKYQSKDTDKNNYLYYDKSGYCYWYKNDKWKDKAVDIVANACCEPQEKISGELDRGLVHSLGSGNKIKGVSLYFKCVYLKGTDSFFPFLREGAFWFAVK